MEEFSDRQISQLSGGQQQRVFLARALVQDAEVYFMDEPFQGVDSKTEKSIVDILKKLRNEGKTVIAVHHDLQTVKEYFDYVTFINISVMASGHVNDVFTEENIEKTYKNKSLSNKIKENLEVKKVGDAVSHASLPGVCIAFLLTNSKNTEILLMGALSVGIICIGLIQVIQNYTKIKFDSALAFILSVFFGMGLVLMSYLNKLPGANKSGLNKFIFGQASTFLERDVNIMLYVGIVLLIIITLFWKEFKISSFDADFTSTLGFHAKAIGMFISFLIVITVIIGIQAAGVILISAMIISPAVAARQWTDRLSVMVVLAGIFGGFSGFLGTAISISKSDLPTGPVIVILISMIVIFSIMFSSKRGIVFKIIRNSKRKKILTEKLEKQKAEKAMFRRQFHQSEGGDTV